MSAETRLSRGRRIGIAAAALVLALTAPALLSPGVAGAAPQAPQVDPFYQPPADFAAAAPGTVLRSRPVRVGLPVAAQAWQLLYRSTDLFDNPDVTVTTVILPDAARLNPPLLSYQIYEDASGPACVPSYTLQAGSPFDLATTAQVLPLLQQLSEGWVVSVPDFEGRFGHFAVAKEPGYMSLDGIRAAEQFAPLGLGPHTRVGLFGYSGGGLATAWAAQMQPGYAPELDIAGIALSAPGADLGAAVRATNGGPLSGLIGSGLASLYGAYPDFKAALRPHLTPAGDTVLHQIRSQCVFGVLISNLFRNWREYLDLPVDQLLALPPIRATLDRIALGAPAPTAPLFVYQGLVDEVTPAVTTDRIVEKYCAAGTSVTYIYDRTAEHLITIETGWVPAFHWLRQRLDTRTPTPTGCNNQTVLSGLGGPH
ncbi:lipase family protein [Nocardia sp. NPDC051570]|uniref:lipase family protein n=1 Tax=Nocardia sp. NPDC051570 TaxID=3364324 RepID=UPI00379661B2